MKKTILALAISSVSTGVFASETLPLCSEVEFNKEGNENVYKCETVYGGNVTLEHSNWGDGQLDIRLNNEHTLESGAKLSVSAVLNDDAEDDNGRDFDDKSKVVKLESADGENSISRVTYEDGLTGESVKATTLNKGGVEVTVTATTDENGITVYTTQGDAPTEQKIAIVNNLLSAAESSAHITVQSNGDAVITYTDKSGNTAHFNLSNASEEELAMVKSMAKFEIIGNIEERRLGVPVELDPIEGDPNFNNPVIIDPIEKGGNPVHGDIPNEEQVIDKVASIKEMGRGSNEQISAINDSLKGTGYRIEKVAVSTESGSESGIIIHKKDGTSEFVSESEVSAKMQEMRNDQEKRADERSNPAPVVPIGDVVGGDATAEVIKYRATEAIAQVATDEQQDIAIALNKQAIEGLYAEVDRLDEKMDGVMAGVHAVNNARPYLSSEGDTAIGAGVGYAGDAGAVAFGAAHAFTDSLSASMTLNVTTGSYSEVSGGAGVQYKF